MVHPPRLALLLLAAGLLLASRPALGQAPTPEQHAERAEALLAARDFGGAADALAAYLRERPGDAAAWERLGQARYWSGDVAGARAAFAEGLGHHPGHVGLRLARARMLAETNDPEARAALEPLREEPAAAAEAERLLGTLAYWAGDLGRASGHLRRARALDPGDAEAARLLREIRAGARPWASVQAGGQTDTQPLGGGATHAEAGAFLTPLQTLRVQAGTRRLAGEAEPLAVTSAGAAYRAFWPRLRLDTDLAAGALVRSGGAAPDWTGRLGLGLRLPRHASLNALAERAGYFYTLASVETPVTTQSAALTLGWTPPGGWAGQAGLRRTAFGDGNGQTDAWAWALAPVLGGAWGGVQAGYAFGYQHADTSRFQAVLTAPPTPRQPAQFEGRYAPYYTPDALRVHSLAWAVQLRPHRRVAVHGGGGYGVRATERAPFFAPLAPGGPPVRGTYDHAFHPWDARASVELAAGGGVTVAARASHLRTAFYDASEAALSLHYRLP